MEWGAEAGFFKQINESIEGAKVNEMNTNEAGFKSSALFQACWAPSKLYKESL
jgi:hypothetical protein